MWHLKGRVERIVSCERKIENLWKLLDTLSENDDSTRSFVAESKTKLKYRHALGKWHQSHAKRFKWPIWKVRRPPPVCEKTEITDPLHLSADTNTYDKEKLDQSLTNENEIST